MAGLTIKELNALVDAGEISIMDKVEYLSARVSANAGHPSAVRAAREVARDLGVFNLTPADMPKPAKKTTRKPARKPVTTPVVTRKTGPGSRGGDPAKSARFEAAAAQVSIPRGAPGWLRAVKAQMAKNFCARQRLIHTRAHIQDTPRSMTPGECLLFVHLEEP